MITEKMKEETQNFLQMVIARHRKRPFLCAECGMEVSGFVPVFDNGRNEPFVKTFCPGGSTEKGVAKSSSFEIRPKDLL